MIFQESTVVEGSTRFEDIALRHTSYLYKTAYWLTGNKAVAEDLTQETLLIATQKFTQLRELNKCRSWLSAILRNLFSEHIKKDRSQVFVDFEDIANDLADKSHETGGQMQDGFSDAVQHQLDRLDEKYKTPLVMSVLGEYSYREIAEKLDIPIGTVMSRIARGKTFLRREILKKANRESTTRLAELRQCEMF
ncbi:MAG: sigma-70 family RNA polymerase sigma factor [Myxococcales bacterium]|nr:MAG: sigma-70 family RNA polymerase sigma factor [Myxococcales bacterium]